MNVNIISSSSVFCFPFSPRHHGIPQLTAAFPATKKVCLVAPAAVLLLLDMAAVLKRIIDVTKLRHNVEATRQDCDVEGRQGGVILGGGRRAARLGYSPVSLRADDDERLGSGAGEDDGEGCNVSNKTLGTASHSLKGESSRLDPSRRERIGGGELHSSGDVTVLDAQSVPGRPSSALASAGGRDVESGLEGDVRRRYAPFSIEPRPLNVPSEQNVAFPAARPGTLQGRRGVTQWFINALPGLESALDAAVVIQVWVPAPALAPTRGWGQDPLVTDS